MTPATRDTPRPRPDWRSVAVLLLWALAVALLLLAANPAPLALRAP